MELKQDDIFQLTSTIWVATLNLPIEPASRNATPSNDRSTAACIQLTGAWNGAVLLDCPSDVARQAASVMFAAPAESMTVKDLQDAIAELVNMIGGNIKALLPETCYLSLPNVVEGGDYSARVPGSRPLTAIQFNCCGQTVSIKILERIEQHTIAA